MRHSVFFAEVALAGCVLALSGCGGGGSGSGSGAVTVVPGATSTATPTPTTSPSPTPASTGARVPTSSSVAFATSQVLTVTEGAQGLQGGSTSGRSVTSPGALRLSYNGNTRTYTLTNDQRTASFGPSDFTIETSRPDYFPRVEYALSSSSTADFLYLFKEANATPTIPTAYGAYGAWQHNIGPLIQLDYFVYGEQTPVASMPHTGVVTYRLSGTGNYAEDKKLYFTQSYMTVRVDFATGEVITDIGLSGSDFLSGSTGGLIGARFIGKVSGSAADGSLTFTVQGWTGTARLVFFGPNAENAGIIYSASAPYASFNGAAVGVTP